MEGIEKIYCCDRNDNDNALAAAILAGRDHRGMDPALTAMMANGGMNGMWNNPFVYLVWMMFAGRFFNNGGWDGNGNCQGVQNVEMQNQLQAIRSQLQDNQNSNLLMDAVKGNNVAIGQLAQNLNCDFNTLNSCCCDLRQAIAQVAGQIGFSAEKVINAVNMGDCNVIQAIKDCCCQTQRQVADFRADMQLQMCQQTNNLTQQINTLSTGVERGFSQTAYETQKQTCDIINNQNTNTQRLIDLLNSHWSSEDKLKIQDLKNELSQERQTRQLLAAMNGGNCGCNTGCGCSSF